MITFSSENPEIEPVVIGWIRGPQMFELLHLPRLDKFTLYVDQLPQFKSCVADLLHFDSPIEKIAEGSRFRYDVDTIGSAQFMRTKLFELAVLADACIQSNHNLQWEFVPNEKY
jgi:hypothetical protein